MEPQGLEKESFSHFVSSPLREKYPKTSFVKSRCFSNQEDDKMNFFQSHFWTNIFKPCSWNWCWPYWELIQSSLQGGPFGGPACPPVMFNILKIFLGRLEIKKIEKRWWGEKNGLFFPPPRSLPHNSTRNVWADNVIFSKIKFSNISSGNGKILS